jgi:hypothetical protein
MDTSLKKMDNTGATLLTLSVLSGGVTTDLFLKGDYYSGAFFLILTGVLIFVREYFKLS